jgi:hypothetical protein
MHQETCGNTRPIAALKGCAVRLQLLDYVAAAKHRGEHQRGHAAAVVGINVRAEREQLRNHLLHLRGRQAGDGSIG